MWVSENQEKAAVRMSGRPEQKEKGKEQRKRVEARRHDRAPKMERLRDADDEEALKESLELARAERERLPSMACQDNVMPCRISAHNH